MSLEIIKLVNRIKVVYKKIQEARSVSKCNDWDEAIGKSILYLTTNKNLPEDKLIESLTVLLKRAEGVLEKVHAPLNLDSAILN